MSNGFAVGARTNDLPSETRSPANLITHYWLLITRFRGGAIFELFEDGGAELRDVPCPEGQNHVAGLRDARGGSGCIREAADVLHVAAALGYALRQSLCGDAGDRRFARGVDVEQEERVR